MKQILIMLLCVACLRAYGQSDRELLLELVKQQAENNKQMSELAKQQAVTSTKIEGVDKRLDSMDKRLDGMDKRLDFMQMLLLIIIPLVLTSVVGIIGFVLWDRSTAIRPVEAETKKEIEKLKEREQKLEERLETALKKIAQIEPRFTGIL